jgi:hypothetical protein
MLRNYQDRIQISEKKKITPEHIAPIITRADGLCVKLSRRAFCRVSEATDEVVCIVAPYRTSFLCILNFMLHISSTFGYRRSCGVYVLFLYKYADRFADTI